MLLKRQKTQKLNEVTLLSMLHCLTLLYFTVIIKLYFYDEKYTLLLQ